MSKWGTERNESKRNQQSGERSGEMINVTWKEQTITENERAVTGTKRAINVDTLLYLLSSPLLRISIGVFLTSAISFQTLVVPVAAEVPVEENTSPPPPNKPSTKEKERERESSSRVESVRNTHDFGKTATKSGFLTWK